MPAAIDGKWYIYYKGSYAWSHFEAPAAKGVTGVNELSDNIFNVYPNPFASAFYLTSASLESLEMIQIYNQQGKLVNIIDPSGITGNSIELGNDLPSGVYILQLIQTNSINTFKLIKE